MKYLVVIAALLGLATPLFGEDKPYPLKDLKDKASYAIGIDVGMNFKKQSMELNPEAMAAGARDALTGKPQLGPTEVREVMTEWQKQFGEKQKAMATKK